MRSSPVVLRPTSHHHRSHNRRPPTKLRNVFVAVGIVLLVLELLLLRIAWNHPLPSASTTQDATPLDQIQQAATHPRRQPDGTFNGYPVYYQDANTTATHTKPYSLLHCVGENYQAEINWMHRSCHFRFFCFNVDSKEFSIYQRPEDVQIRKWSDQIPLMDISQSYIQSSSSVSLGGINQKWGKEGMARLEWFPNIMSEPPSQFYTLPDHVVMIPFHSLAGWNPGHLVWDDFLPLFTLLKLFSLGGDDDNKEILALRHVLPGEGMWASCDAPAKKELCVMMQRKFWPLLNNHSLPTTQLNAQLEIMETTGQARKSPLVCAKDGLAGIGALTDHGTHKLHGWHKEDYETSHNHGRGGMLWKFRTFCLNNLGIQDSPSTRQAPFQIIFSVQSSSNPLRNLDFSRQEHMLRRQLDPSEATIESKIFKDLSLKDQVQLVTETSIFITGCGGGAVTATFLPRGATVIIFYNEVGGRVANVPTNLPARLDWDLFNHLAYLHVHWFPSGTMNKMEDLVTLIQVVQDDLKRRKRELDMD
jgi:hypothetical protein